MTSRALSNAEIEAILSHLKTDRDKCLFILGIKTGFRISELLSLTFADVYNNGAVVDNIVIQRRNMKGKRRSRSVPLHPLAKQYIMQYCINYALIDKLFPIGRIQAYRIIATAARKAGLTGCIATHSMRKTFGQNVYKRTNNIVAAQRALGHASLSSTTHYLSVGQDEVDEAILA